MSDVLVLCYHAVSERWPAPLSVTPDALAGQMQWLAREGYRGTTFHQAVTDPPAARTVALTFDDAYRSVLERGLPILERFGFPATVFVATAFAGSERPMPWPGTDRWVGGPHEHELVPMSWDELRGLGSRGWEIGSHTRTHPRLTELAEADLNAELVEARADCEHALDRPCNSLAYPYGDHDDRVVAAAAAAGYTAAGTLPARLHPTSPLRFPRIGVYHADGPLRFRLKAMPRARRLRSSGAAVAVTRLRASLPGRTR